MKPTYVPPLTEQQLAELDDLYRTTKVPRLRTRAQMVLLSAAGRKVGEIAEIVRESEATVLRWFKRYVAEGIAGLHDAPRSGRDPTVTDAYREKLVAAVRRRPRSLDLPFSVWTLQRLADYMAEEAGIRVSDETVRRTLKAADIAESAAAQDQQSGSRVPGKKDGRGHPRWPEARRCVLWEKAGEPRRLRRG